MDGKKTKAAAGVAAIGDENNIISLMWDKGILKLIQVKGGKEHLLATRHLPVRETILIQMRVKNGKDISFFYSTNQKDFKPVNTKLIDGTYLPPWDRALRVGVIARGSRKSAAVFDRFELINH